MLRRGVGARWEQRIIDNTQRQLDKDFGMMEAGFEIRQQYGPGHPGLLFRARYRWYMVRSSVQLWICRHVLRRIP